MYLQFNNSRYFYATNIQGDVTAILNTSGTAVVQYTYDAWGNILSITGTMASDLGAHNPLRYRGYVYDTETGLYYLQSRYYDPALGRFINADILVSTGQGLLGNNMFAYCGNNPVNRQDAIGMLWGDVSYAVSLEGGGATIHDVLVISIGTDDWMSTSETMGANFMVALGADAYQVVAVTADNFKDVWENTSAEYVIIHTHGSPDSLSNTGWRIAVSDINKMQCNSNIQYVLITACEAGGSNGLHDNVGQMISKKINAGGKVMCSTTRVGGGATHFTAKYGGKWVVYSNGIQLSANLWTTITIPYAARYFNGTYFEGGAQR